MENSERNLQFEDLISGLSTTLVEASEDRLESELNGWLEKFVKLLDVDRVIVNEYLDDRKTISTLMHYTMPGVEEQIPEGQYQPPEGVIWEFEKGLIIKAEKIPDDLPEIFHGGLIHRTNTKSIVVVPLAIGNKVIGNLAFLNYRKERKWDDDLVRRIKLIGEIIANAVQRMRSYETLIKEMERRQILEERYTSIIKGANVGFCLSDIDQNILEVNDEYCRMSGYGRDELLSMKITDFDITFYEDDAKISEEILRTGSVHHEVIHRKKDGGLMDIAVSSTLNRKDGILYSFMRDITELKKTRNELEERLRFEELNSEFSAALVNVTPEYINDELNRWVKKFVHFLKVDRGVFHEYDYANRKINIIVSYTDPEVDEVVAPLLKSHTAPDEIMKEFKTGVVIRAEKIPEDLPVLFQSGILEKHNTKSIVIVPLIAEDKVIGNLTFAGYRKEHKWPDDLVRRIKLIGEIVANAILRTRAHKNLLEEMEHRKVLEETYSGVIKNSNLGFMIIDLSGHSIIDVNDEYCRMSGYSRDELLSKKTWEIDVSNDAEKVRNEGAVAIKEGSIHITSSHLRKDGSIFDVEISSNVFGRKNIVYSFVHDITDQNRIRRELEERLQFEELVSEFSAAISNLRSGDINKELDDWLKRFADLVNIDRCGIGEYTDNDTSYRFISTYTNPTLDSRPPSYPSIIRSPLYGHRKYLERGEVIKIENHDDVLPNDLDRWKQAVIESGAKSALVVPLRSGDILLGSLVLDTVVSNKEWSPPLVRSLKLVAEIFANVLLKNRKDSELEIYRKHLENMVEERTSKLEEAQKELVTSEKMATLGKLTSTVSHELRNPLGTIRSSLFALNQLLKEKSDNIKSILERAERSIQRCDLIIEELLNYSRNQALALERTDIDNWLSRMIAEDSPPAGIMIVKELNTGGESIDMDRERFRRCMVNILTNAYHAIQAREDNAPTGFIKVITERNEKGIKLSISDNGVGICREELRMIFEPLYSTKPFGIGLGLPITKQIIDMHGWDIDIDGELGKGTVVTIDIPKKRHSQHLR